ncbi:hypothetical protein ACF0H5_011467 [Mactra antiquata]
MFRNLCFLFTILWVQTVVSTNYYDDMTRLLEYEWPGYKSDVIPRTNIHSHVSVALSAVIKSINDMNADLNELSIKLALTMAWNDDRLAWDVPTYNDIREIHIPATKIWIPDLSVHNSANSPKEDVTPAIIEFIGKVRVTKFIYVKAPCKMNYEAFPNDHHTCRISIASWKYSSSHLLMEWPLNVTVENDAAKTEWSIKRNLNYTLLTSAPSKKQNDNFQELNIILEVERNSNALRYVFILPLIIMSAMFPVQFILPKRCNRYILGLLCIIVEIISFVNVCLYTHSAFSLSSIGIMHIVSISFSTFGIFVSAVEDRFSLTKRACTKIRGKCKHDISEGMEPVDTDDSPPVANGHVEETDATLDKMNTIIKLMNKSIESKTYSQLTHVVLFVLFVLYFIALTIASLCKKML